MQTDKRWYRVVLLGYNPNRKFMKGKIMKKTLFAVALLASSSAFAMDVSNPFYVPMKGDFLSETSYTYNNWEHSEEEDATIAETLSYGVTKNFALNATVGTNWLYNEWLQPDPDGHDRYDNPFWDVGMKYNLIDCCKTNWKVQLGANYSQGEWGGHPLARWDHHHNKYISGYVKAGYQMGRFLPYLTATIEKPIGRYEGQPVIGGRAALNTVLTKKTNLDLGITYEWDNDTDWGKHASAWVADGALNYVFSDCMSTGLTGAYLMRTKPWDEDAFKIGVNFKVAF